MKRKMIFVIFFLALLVLDIKSIPFNKVVIWGHKLNTRVHLHTHSYIHEAFYRAFKSMDYETYWFDDQDDVSKVDFRNALFITEGQVDKRIPLQKSSYYILHNCDDSKYKKLLDAKHAITLQVFTDKCLKMHKDLTKIDNFIYGSAADQFIYMPWATNLLPHEIDIIEEELKRDWSTHRSNKIYWVGTIGEGKFGNVNKINPFKDACISQNIKFIAVANSSLQRHIKAIFASYMAPTIVGDWQEVEGYIPCRIFKNMSYGQFGVTNCKNAYELFERKIVYNANTYDLFFDAQKRLAEITLDDQLELMDIVKNKHTYINRIQTLLAFFDAIQ